MAARGTRFYLSNLNGIEGYRIDPDTGGISPLPGSPVAGPLGTLIRDPLERFVWRHTSGTIQAFRVDASTGQLTPSGPPTPVSPFLGPLVLDPEGRLAYGFAERQLVGYRFEETGAFTPLAGSPYALTREGVNASDPVPGAGAASSLLFFYSQGDGVRESSVLVYRRDPASGEPQPAFVLPAPEERVVDGLAVSPSGAFLYAAYRNRLTSDARPAIVKVYAIDAASGRLTETATATTGRTFFSDMELSADGRLLLVTLEPSPFELPLGPADLVVFRVEGGTTLTPVAAPYRLGPGPHTLHVFQTQPTR